jgi:DnaD/phage-associated family protein
MGSYTFGIFRGRQGATLIPNLFIEDYMPNADGNFVKVYLLGLLEATEHSSISGDQLSSKLGIIESDIIKAWEYWESMGLVTISKSGSDIVNIEFANLFDINNVNKKLLPSGSAYTPEFIHSKLNNPKLKDMFESIEKLVGRMLSPKEISMYLSWIDDYGFTPEVITLLTEYCKSKNKVDTRYIEKVAIAWHDANIKTAEDAQKSIAQYEGRFDNFRLVLDFLGLKENEIMKPQEELLDKWFNTWGFNLEMVLEACKICSLRINEPNFSYIDGILSNWYKKGVKVIKDIEALGTKKKSKNVGFKAPVTTFNSYDQRSYDIKDLERKLFGINEDTEDEQ